MQRDIFAAGVAPGSPNTQSEIKTLLCYLLSHTNTPMTFQQIHKALREDELVNYFELVTAVDSLVESGHFIKDQGDPEHYIASDLGRETAKTLDTSLPYTVREKALSAADRVVLQKKRLEEVKTNIIELPDGGFNVEMSIPEETLSLISFTVYAPTKQEAEKIEKGFLNDPIFLYQSVMALLLGDLKVLGDLRPSEEKLFR